MNNINKISFGTPEKITPVKLLSERLPLNTVGNKDRFNGEIKFEVTPRGTMLYIPLDDKEQIYGFGLQMKSLNQVGKKKTVRVNSDPVADSGDSHAPVPYYVSTNGYAVLIDTARYAAFYVSSCIKLGNSNVSTENKGADNTDQLYAARNNAKKRFITIEIPYAQGIDIYTFDSDNILGAVAEYNRFSGGGCMPPVWGLGVWYRAYSPAKQKDIYNIMDNFRNENIPCDVFGLEPFWQSKAYSCSYSWNNEHYPDSVALIERMKEKNFKVNLWEHAYIHPTSPIYERMKDFSGDYEVWEGLVPDFATKEGRRIFAEYHRKELVDKGISGFKLDECDNSDFNQTSWSFPEFSKFPCGADGEQMHSMLGLLYQQTIMDAFAHTGKRYYHAVRSSGAFAAPMPFVLYSDLYDHKDFIRSIVTASFSGMLWTPEVRQCSSVEDLYRRIQSVIFSPMALVNAWMVPHEPWKQFDEVLNKQGVFLENKDEVTAEIKRLFEFRMSLVPYLYTAYRKYETEGIPPFRAMVLDYPDDPETYYCDLQYMVGDSMLVAPLVEGEYSRWVYLPKGKWHCLHTGSVYEGGKWYEIEADIKSIPVFIKDGTIIPYAESYEFFKEGVPLRIVPKKYGDAAAICNLFEDDGVSFNYKNGDYNIVTINWPEGADKPEISRDGKFEGRLYVF